MQTMKACVLHGVGDLRYEDVPVPALESGQVLVKVQAVGICGSDIPRVFKTGTYHFPTIPGHEFAGQVVKAYDKENEHLIGLRVAVFPLMPCRECNSCKVGSFELCENYDYIGSRRDGAFAEYVAVPVWNLAPIPDSLSYEAAAMTEPVAVALHALRQAKIEIGDTVAIFGPGTIGTLVAQWAKAWGASKVMLIGIDDQSIEVAKQLGFKYCINSKKVDAIEWISEMTNGVMADIAVDAVGSALTFSNCLLGAAAGGKVIAIGNPNGDYTLQKDIYWKLLRKQLKVYGTWNSGFDGSPHSDWAITIEAMANKSIHADKLITHRFKLSELMDGLTLMRDVREPYKKVMIVFD